MTTPNTPAELVAQNERPQSPYDRPAVKAAMEALEPKNGGNMGDLQAVAEICISILKDIAADDAENDNDREWRQISAEIMCNLKIAEAFLEKAGYIHMNDDEDA